ncbi:hypothetical protein [Streptomyces sp. NPDC053048]|uniref:hypothetical protein n=1 Tax=Streptomyces sp. NPDC053048 TaxID=3365694 RepID=UPI0037D8B8EC
MSAGRQAPVTARPRPRPQARLPWWALALPAAAFVTLFWLLSSPASAHDGPAPAGGTITRVVQLVQHTAARWAP